MADGFEAYWEGLDKLWQIFGKTGQAADNGAKLAVTLMTKAIEREAKRSIDGRPYERRKSKVTGRVYYKRNPARAVNGAPPQNMTGMLKRSIGLGAVRKIGYGKYQASVTAGGTGVEYAYYLEVGLKSGISHPFMNPAYDRLKMNGTLGRIYEQSMKRFL